MRYRGLLLFVVLLLIAGSAMAFNGERKGFVLGGGLGFAPVSRWSVDMSPYGTGPYDFDETKAGVALHLVIGHAWDEHNMIVYEGNVTGYSSEDEWDDRMVSQGFNGAAWYHYFGPAGKSAFTVGGLGFYVFHVEDFDANDPGFGVLLGGGYEFARHWQVGGYVSFGSSSSEGVDFTHNHISVLVSGVAF